MWLAFFVGGGDDVVARERNPERDKAKQMWLESGGTMKLKDIAAALSIPEGRARKWKSVDRWQYELKGNVLDSSYGNVPNGTKGNAPNPRGAPKGNKNAVGNPGGAPPGNQNAKGNSGGPGGPFRNKKALKTGMYETIFLDTLEPNEQDTFNQIPYSFKYNCSCSLHCMFISRKLSLILRSSCWARPYREA
ncbi:phage terminase small subunit-related protein [Paenibacillus kribbensis]|uniref:phage terminase small subunit-related protein n=1 Tax=Paenibacillus kribbensis TaxID=172713 RepID=UPI001FC95C53|nr:phage terminase small subunit-related protein [Paenibacillus kribbensis]